MGQADSVHGAWAFFLAGIELLFILHDIYCGCGWVWVGGWKSRLSLSLWDYWKLTEQGSYTYDVARLKSDTSVTVSPFHSLSKSLWMCRRKEKTERKRARERDIKQKAQRGRSRRASLTLRAGLRRREHLKVNTAEGVTEKSREML